MRKLRILHLIKSLNRGGAETLLAEGLRFADRDQFEFSYGYFNPTLNALAPVLASRGARVTCLGSENHLGMFARMPAVTRLLRENGIDLLHCHLPMAGVVGRLAALPLGIPVVYTEHNKPEWYRKPTFLFNSWTYAYQRQVIAVSASVEQSIRKYIGSRVPIQIVRNGIDSAFFRRAPASGALLRERLGIPASARVIGNVAALIPQKRLHDWIHAARIIASRHPEVHFLLIGEGPQLEGLKRGIQTAGLQQSVHLCGVQADVRPYLSVIDIYMMSSAYEGLPVALLEAMAMECAPVCTNVGGIGEVLQNGGNGLLTDFANPSQLASAVVGLLDNPERCLCLAGQARRTVERAFAIDRMVRDLEAIYVTVLNQPPVARPHLPPSQVAPRPVGAS